MAAVTGIRQFTTPWVETKYYTGLNINSTPASRTGWTVGTTAATRFDTELQIGSVVIIDPNDNGDGRAVGECVTRPQTSHLVADAYVVVSLDPACNDIVDTSTNQRRGGAVGVVRLASGIPAVVKANATIYDALTITNGTFCLSKLTDSSIDTIAEQRLCKGIAGETADTSTTPAVKKVNFGPT